MAKFTQFALPFHLEVIQRHRSNIERVRCSFSLSPLAYLQSSVAKWTGTGTHVGINGLGSIGLLGANLQEKQRAIHSWGFCCRCPLARGSERGFPLPPAKRRGEIGRRERWKIYDKGKKEWQERKEKGWRVRERKTLLCTTRQELFVNGEKSLLA